MSSAAAPRVGVSTGIEDVDAATLSEVFSRLDPASILSASASSKHLASAADEPLWRDVFAKSWDEPVWEVSSYRHLHLVRHRALLLLRSLPDAPPPDDDPDAWLAVADACDVVASAVNASLRVERTDATIDDANITPTLARLLRAPTVAAPRVAPRVAPRRRVPRRVSRVRRVRTQKPPTSRATPRRKPFHRSSRGVSRGVRPRRYPRGWRLGREGSDSESSRVAADFADLAPRRDDDDAFAAALKRRRARGGARVAARDAAPPED